MRYRSVAGSAGLEEFARRFLAASGVAMPLDYLERAAVTGMFDDDDRLIGGYAVALGHAGRWIEQIPVPTPLHPHVHRTLELNGIWLIPQAQGRSASATLWTRIGADLGARDVEHIVFGVNARRAGLIRLYDRIAAGVLYEGGIRNSSLATARFYYSFPHRFAALPDLYARELLRRKGTPAA